VAQSSATLARHPDAPVLDARIEFAAATMLEIEGVEIADERAHGAA
jgi:hypothetical protein